MEGRGRDLNSGERLHRPLCYQATPPRPLFHAFLAPRPLLFFSRVLLGFVTVIANTLFSFAEDFPLSISFILGVMLLFVLASYYSSYTQTAMVVQGAEATPEPTAPVAQTPYEMYTIGMGIAIIIAIAVVGMLLLRTPISETKNLNQSLFLFLLN